MQGTSIYVAGDTNREQSKGLQKRSKEALAGWLGGWVAGVVGFSVDPVKPQPQAGPGANVFVWIFLSDTVPAPCGSRTLPCVFGAMFVGQAFPGICMGPWS